MRRMAQVEVAEGKVEEGPRGNKSAAQHPINTTCIKTSNDGSVPAHIDEAADEAAMQPQGAEVLSENVCGGQECSLQQQDEGRRRRGDKTCITVEHATSQLCVRC